MVENGVPVFGLIYVPPTGRLYLTRSDGRSYGAVVRADDALSGGLDSIAFERLMSRAPEPARLRAYNSRTAGGASADFLAELAVHEAQPLGSSEKFCLIAAGEGDLYARFGPTYEWDTAAGQAILEAAGGTVTTLDGARLSYGKSAGGYLNPHFVAWGRMPLLTGFSGAKAGSRAARGS